MKETLKNVVYAGVGAAFLTKEKIEEIRSELIERGKMTRDESRQFVDDLIKRSEGAKEELERWLCRQVEERVEQLHLATRDEVEELRRRIEALEASMRQDQD